VIVAVTRIAAPAAFRITGLMDSMERFRYA